MSDTYYAQAIRFQKRYAAPTLTPTSAAYTAAVAAWYGLQAEPWHKVDAEKPAVLTPHEIDGVSIPADREYYDAYELCAEHASSQHRCYAGMVAYRIKLPDAAIGVSLTSLAVLVASDPYNPYGARVALKTTSDADPTDCWTCAREGGLDSDASLYASGVAPRTASADGTLWYGATAMTTITPAGGMTLQKYLWVFLSLENYQRSRNGWLEGSSAITPVFTLVTGAPITGYADGSNVGGGYGDEATDSMVLSQSDKAIDFPRQMSNVPSVSVARRTFMREYFYACAQVYGASDAAGWRALFGLLQTAAIGKFNKSDSFSAQTTDYGAAGTVMTYLDVKASPSLYSGTTHPQYIASQFGLVAHVQHTSQVGTLGAAGYKAQRLTMRLCPYILPAGEKLFSPSRLIIKNGATALSLGGAGVRLTAWWVPGYSALHATDYPLYPIHALASLPAFWLGDADSVSGSITDVTGVSDATVLTFTLSATKLGLIMLPDSIAVGQEIEIPMSSVPSSRGMIILAPFVVDAGLSIAADTTVGLGSSFLYTTDLNNLGWRPEVRFEA